MSITPNQRAFLDMLAWAEGTDNGRQPTANKGYDVIVGGGLLTDYSKHPNKPVWLARYQIYSTAAGRYQFLRATWNTLKTRLKLPDFSPASQDLACLELLRECGALKRLDEGDLRGAVQAARKIWASLPGAGYGQLEQDLAKLQAKYVAAGGALA